MPVEKVYKDGKMIGYRWGKRGKIYKRKKDAERQGRAIKASIKKKVLSIIDSVDKLTNK